MTSPQTSGAIDKPASLAEEAVCIDASVAASSQDDAARKTYVGIFSKDAYFIRFKTLSWAKT